MPEAKVLGQLLLMQNVLINLPDKNSIFSFVCKGLLDIPGVESAQYSENSKDFQQKSALTFYFGTKETKFGAIHIKQSDTDLFKSYEQYLRNFFFMIEVILEERHKKHLLDLHQSELEKKVKERTKQLQKEIEDRKKTVEKLKQSEQKYRSLFENMTTGFAIHEMIFDDKGNSTDYRFIEVNPAFEKLTGLKSEDIIDKKATEVIPGIEKDWIKTFGRVVKTGDSIAYHNNVSELGRYFDTWIFKTDKNNFAVIFTDVSERVKAEKVLAF